MSVRRQPYRGNPEIKEYSIYSNFSGGMNTTAHDEALFTHETRLLKNAELLEEGVVQNRKGFKSIPVLYAISENSNDKLSSLSNVKMFKPVKDSHNILDKMINFKEEAGVDTYDKFNELYSHLNWVLKFIIICDYEEDYKVFEYVLNGYLESSEPDNYEISAVLREVYAGNGLLKI